MPYAFYERWLAASQFEFPGCYLSLAEELAKQSLVRFEIWPVPRNDLNVQQSAADRLIEFVGQLGEFLLIASSCGSQNLRPVAIIEEAVVVIAGGDPMSTQAFRCLFK